MDSEKLIEEVRKFPVIYDPSSEKYRNVDYKETVWRKICAKLQIKDQTSEHKVDVDVYHTMLDPQLRPIPPDPNCERSVQIYKEHDQKAKEYFKMQTEMAFLSNSLSNLSERLSVSTEKEQLDIQRLETEKESLIKLKESLKQQLENQRYYERSNRPMTIMHPPQT